jgi:hypothetical protein
MLRVTYVGGPTALLELGGLRLLTDPTFDPAGTEYRTPSYVLRKTGSPALSSERRETGGERDRPRPVAECRLADSSWTGRPDHGDARAPWARGW